MQKFYFLDESGDADFFGKKGKRLWETEQWHPVLIMGLLETSNRKQLRKDIVEFHTNLPKDTYYNGICSLGKENHFLHARADHPEVRAAFFQFLRSRNDFMLYFSIVEKDPEIFISTFNKKPNSFYFHVVEHLLKMPPFRDNDTHAFYLSRRTKNTHADFDRVLKTALVKEMSAGDLRYSADIVKSSEYPELSVIDYMLWSMQRWVMKGEARFLKTFSDRIGGIVCGKGELNNTEINKLTLEEFLTVTKEKYTFP